MPMTMTEKILARASGKHDVRPGDNVWVNVDVLMTHDVCGPGTIGIFKREFGKDARVWDREKVVIIPDHYIFTADDKCHRNVDILREFVREQQIPHYYDVGSDRYKGVCHIALPEGGHTRPGKLLVKVPPTMRFVFAGEFPPYVLAKDVILQVIGDIGVDGGTTSGT